MSVDRLRWLSRAARLSIGVCCLVALVAAYALLARYVLHGEVTDREGSGSARYTVRRRPGSSCWDAALTADSSEGGMLRRVSGCVHRWKWSLVSLG